jgi:uncharacterized damage-inducible protein DinB
MDVHTIRMLDGYNTWANEAVLRCCESLGPGQLVEPVEGIPWGSIRNQFVHQFLIHKRWLSWADGTLSGEDAYALQADPEEFADLSALREMWDDLNAQSQHFLSTVTDSQLKRELHVDAPWAAFRIPIWQVLLHIVHHSMQHRTETTVALSHFGVSPGDIDYIFYTFE